MKTKIYKEYICEVCGDYFDSEKEAAECEKYHLDSSQKSTIAEAADEYRTLKDRVEETVKKLDKNMDRFNSIVNKIQKSQGEYCKQCINAYADKFIYYGGLFDKFSERLNNIEKEITEIKGKNK